jgi:hypothetical protein
MSAGALWSRRARQRVIGDAADPVEISVVLSDIKTVVTD